MQIQVHYHGLDNTPWMDQFITNRVSKLNRYLSPSASAHISLKMENQLYVTILSIHNLTKDFSFTAQGENLYESFQLATDKAARVLGEHKRMLKDKIHRKTNILKDQATA